MRETVTDPIRASAAPAPAVGYVFSPAGPRPPASWRSGRRVAAGVLGLAAGAATAAAVWLALPASGHTARVILQWKPMPTAAADADKQSLGRLLQSEAAAHRPADSLRLDWAAPDRLAVSLTGGDPGGLRAGVEALTAAAVGSAGADVARSREEGRQSQESLLRDLGQQIEHGEKRLRQLARLGAGDVAQLAEEVRGVSRTLAGLQVEGRRLQAQADALAGRLAETDRQPVPTDERAKAMTDPAVAARAAERDRLRARVERMEKQYQPTAPALVAARKEWARLDAAVRAELDRVGPAAERAARDRRRLPVADELKAVRGQIEANAGAVARTRADLEALERKQRVVRAPQLQLVEEQAALARLKDQRGQVEQRLTADAVQPQDDPPVAVQEPVAVTAAPNPWRTGLTAAAFVTVGGLVAAGGGRGRRVDSAERVATAVGLRVLGSIPAFPSQQVLQADGGWRFALNESVNSARTMILHAAKSRNMQVLMVTSAVQGEGKTSLSSQLATSMAAAGLRTLLLDGDLRTPALHRLFAAPLSPGCAEVVCQEADVAEAVRPTAVPNLWLVPAGECSPRVTAALTQGGPLAALFARLRDQFDIVVVDAGPVLSAADTLLVGQQVDGVVISVLQDVSQVPRVRAASDRLAQLNVPLLGAVVSGTTPDVHT
ncbi:MAG: polysaccharide biosynthesis tyrosine autokinase [Gemmataceae bacterium]